MAVVLVGDRDADPLIRPLEGELRRRGHHCRVIAPVALGSTRIACEPARCAVEGDEVRAVVFRASPALLVAPSFTREDAGFAASEIRAAWAHLLGLPGCIAVNRARADGWFSSSERVVWMRRLEARGVALAPRRIGSPFAGGQWTLWTGGTRPAPDPAACERLGAATIAPGPLARALCCGSRVFAADAHGALKPALGAVAEACVLEGLVLCEATVDADGRLVDIEAVPAIPAARAQEIGEHLGRWIDAALRR